MRCCLLDTLKVVILLFLDYLCDFTEESDSSLIFPRYHPYPQDGERGRRHWWMNLVYMHSICGVAQICRSPSIPVESPPSFSDSYTGMPYIEGNPGFEHKPIALKRLTAKERELSTMCSHLDLEVE